MHNFYFLYLWNQLKHEGPILFLTWWYFGDKNFMKSDMELDQIYSWRKMCSYLREINLTIV